MSDFSELRKEVSSWINANWDASLDLITWRKKLADSGWGAPDWPREDFGMGLSPEESSVIEEEFSKKGVIGAAQSGVRLLAAVTILEHGTREQKDRYLKPILTGEENWCQLFSEPGSGSDLAGATTRADLIGDEWIINGQKVWNTSAHHADFGLLVARTNWDVPKHEGISYFIIDMRQEGVEVRQLKQMNGHASFNEVFFTDARVSREDILGAEGRGWQVAMTTLAYERRSFDRARRVSSDMAGDASIYREYEMELEKANEPYKWYPQRAGRGDLVLEAAIETRAIENAAIRQEIARFHVLNESAKWTAARAKAAQKAGQPQGPEGSLGKLAASRVAQSAARVHTSIMGNGALLTGEGSLKDGVLAEVLVSTPAISIAGGTDEIQKNIIAERVLGLPKEPRFDSGPFRDVQKNADKNST